MTLKRANELPRTTARSVYNLQLKGKIRRYIDDAGFVCYDADEYDRYITTERPHGRPPKIITEGKQ